MTTFSIAHWARSNGSKMAAPIRRPVSTVTSQLPRRHYSANAFGQTLVHYLVPHCYNAMEQICDMTRVRSGAKRTALRVFRGTGLKTWTVKLRAVIKHPCNQKNSITLITPKTSWSTVAYILTAWPTRQLCSMLVFTDAKWIGMSFYTIFTNIG